MPAGTCSCLKQRAGSRFARGRAAASPPAAQRRGEHQLHSSCSLPVLHTCSLTRSTQIHGDTPGFFQNTHPGDASQLRSSSCAAPSAPQQPSHSFSQTPGNSIRAEKPEWSINFYFLQSRCVCVWFMLGVITKPSLCYAVVQPSFISLKPFLPISEKTFPSVTINTYSSYPSSSQCSTGILKSLSPEAHALQKGAVFTKVVFQNPTTHRNQV